jgi:hypothetical protein
MNSLRYWGLKIIVKRMSKDIFEEAHFRVTDGSATNIDDAIKQLTHRYQKKVPDDLDTEWYFLLLVWFMVTRELSFDPDMRSEKNASRIGKLSLKEYRKYQRTLIADSPGL